jgi:hypothetical protein
MDIFLHHLITLVAKNWFVGTFGHNLNELVLKTCLQNFSTKNLNIENLGVQSLSP